MLIRITIVLGFLLSGLCLQAQKNQTDEEGRKQGYWEQTYSNGSIKYKGTFKDDKPVGEFMHYDYRLNLKAKVNHLTNDTADAILYHKGMKVAGKGQYVKQQKEGVWSFYDRNERISAKETYHEGVRHGESFTYYLDGSVSRQTNYVKGLETGLRIDYNESGKKIFEGGVVDGVFDGEVTFFHPNGKPWLSGTYRNAVRDGKWIVHDERGIPKKKLDYDLGELPEGQSPSLGSDSITK